MVVVDSFAVNDKVSFVNESHVAVFTFVSFLGKVSGNVPVEVDLRIEGSATGDTFEIFGQVLMHNGVVLERLFPFESFGTNVTHERRLSGMLPLMNLGLVLVTEHHLAVITLDGLDFPKL